MTPRVAAALLVALAGLAPGAGAAPQLARPYPLSPVYHPGDAFQGIRLLGTVALEGLTVDGLGVHGLSGLAWDDDESVLYALSDYGRLFAIRPVLRDGHLVSAEVLSGVPLRDADGAPLRGNWADAEGLDIENGRNGVRGDATLLVSFERDPRVARYDRRGRLLGHLPLPGRLRDVRAYASPNQALESVAVHPTLGVLAAPERPLRGAAPRIIDLVSLSGTRWRYRLSDAPEASLVDLEALPDGSLLALERGHGVMLLPIVIALRRIAPPPPRGGALAVTDVAVLDTAHGWSVDNFEGLTRQRGSTFFMVSDDNSSPLQKTLLLGFELLDRPAGKEEKFDELRRGPD